MTIKLASLKANLKREEQGDWEEFPDWDGVAFKVSSLHLPAYQLSRDMLMQRLARKYKNKPIPRDVMTSEMGKLYATHILHDWRGIDVEYSPDVAADILTNPEYRNIVAAVEFCAAKVSEVTAEFVENEVGNSEGHSAGV